MPSIKGRPCEVCGKGIEGGTAKSITCSMACRKIRLDRIRTEKETSRGPGESSTQAGENWDISLPRTRIHTLEQLIEHFQVDTSVWHVDTFTCNKWEVGAKDAFGKIIIEPLFQVKARLRRLVSVAAAQEAIAEMKEMAKKWAPRPHPVKRKAGGECMLQISVADIHHGKLAWGRETGHGNYDLEESAYLFREAIENLIAKASGYTYQKVLMPLGNDFLQSDNPNNTTTRGTQVDVDGRWKRTYVQMRELVCWSIERLREVAPVVVPIVPGNHDSNSMFTLGDSLQCFFRNYKDVTIDNAPTMHKYVRFGRTLLGLAHGDKIKRNSLYSLMAVECPVDFAVATWREWHLGHLHKSALDEQHGIRTRIIPSLCKADAWHANNGFVGNLRLAESYIWHPEDCLVQSNYYYSPDLREGQAELQRLLDLGKSKKIR